MTEAEKKLFWLYLTDNHRQGIRNNIDNFKLLIERFKLVPEPPISSNL